MDETSAGIESELLDLSTKNVATLRSVELSGMTEAMTRVRLRIADSEGSISGYSGSWTPRPDDSGSKAEEHRG
jgi:RPA family protein